MGYALVLARFIRVSGMKLLLAIADEQALAMILFSNILTILLMVGIGLIVLWKSGIEIRSLTRVSGKANEPA